MILVPIVSLNASDIFRSYFKAGGYIYGRSMSFNKAGPKVKTKPISTIHYKYINAKLRQYTRYDSYDYNNDS